MSTIVRSASLKSGLGLLAWPYHQTAHLCSASRTPSIVSPLSPSPQAECRLTFDAASPHWAINLGSETGPAEWIATGDKDLESVVVTWGGYQVGRIKLDSKRRKHTYILNVAFEMNYCIMAALATVFDDLRTDEGC